VSEDDVLLLVGKLRGSDHGAFSASRLRATRVGLVVCVLVTVTVNRDSQLAEPPKFLPIVPVGAFGLPTLTA
jgi:hypothetical protein